jgi:hypothetical protein
LSDLFLNTVMLAVQPPARGEDALGESLDIGKSAGREGRGTAATIGSA